ncbi:hypothetical protein [Pontibacter liquoris]|uniref:hypothetical protein n=1 Tax=Pontibacter liquoris TaxID=2905677 RepID=UPI001FA78053|nr:hypothetical protein [Pontibacter liquoris]
MLGWPVNSLTCRKLKRTASYEAAYKKWVAAKTYLTWTGPYYKAYHYRKANLTGQYRVQVIEDQSREGVVFYHDPAIGKSNFNFLFDFLKDRILLQGYRLHSMDKQEVRHARYNEQLEKYFLLPPAADAPGSDLCNQLYGNITLDYIKVNKHPGYIRLLVNSYTDPYFSAPLPFTDLLEKVLRPEEQADQK